MCLVSLLLSMFIIYCSLSIIFPFIIYCSFLIIFPFIILVRLAGSSNGGDDQEIYMRVFLSQNYNKNDYSDQTFYNDEDEIVFSVHPKHLRIVVWTGQITTLFRPPSMGRTSPIHGLFLKLTNNKELFKEAVTEFTVSMC